MEGEMFMPAGCPKCRRIDTIHANEEWHSPKQIEIGWELHCSCVHCGTDFTALEIPFCPELEAKTNRYVVEWASLIFKCHRDVPDFKPWQRAALYANLSARLETLLRTAFLTLPQARNIEQLLRGAEHLAQEHADREVSLQ